MGRENTLYGDERPLPYLVRLVRINPESRITLPTVRPMLMHLDFRGGEFSRPTSSRLAHLFDWLAKACRLGRDLTEYALEILPMRFDQAEQVTGVPNTPYIPDDWPSAKEPSFLWIPVPYDENERKYAWQKQ